MKAYENDPQVTAYVLGELEAEEKKQFEDKIQCDPKLKQFVHELSVGAEVLQQVVSSEMASDISLDPERRKFLNEAIRAEQRRDSKVGWWTNRWRLTTASFVGACALATVGLLIFNQAVIFEGSIPQQRFTSRPSLLHDRGELVVSTDIAGNDEAVEPAPVEPLPLMMEEAAMETTASLENPSLGIDLVTPVDSVTAPVPALKPVVGVQPPLSTTGAVVAGQMPTRKLIENTRLNQPTDERVANYAGSVVYGSKGTTKAKKVSDRRFDWFKLTDTQNEGYSQIDEKGFTRIVDAATGTSTFSADVDTASYANVRRYLNSGQLPPVGAVRIEEMVNYFSYDYTEPDGKHPFASDVQVASCPWQPEHRLARIGIKAATVAAENRQPIFQEAQKVFGEQLQGTLATVAKDVKFQIEFNPSKVAAYRLIGYENRMLARKDFNDDTKDAGEVGAGHTVTALYEIVPVGVKGTIADVDEHRYVQENRQEPRTTLVPTSKGVGKNQAQKNNELFFLKIRYKHPDATKSQLLTFPVMDSNRNYTQAGRDFQFAAAVAQAGQLLRGSQYAGDANWQAVLTLARAGRGEDPHGYRVEFIRLSEVARDLQK